MALYQMTDNDLHAYHVSLDQDSEDHKRDVAVMRLCSMYSYNISPVENYRKGLATIGLSYEDAEEIIIG